MINNDDQIDVFRCYKCDYKTNNHLEIVKHSKEQHNYIICEPKQRSLYKWTDEINIYKVNNIKIFTGNQHHKDFVMRTIKKYNYYEPLISIIFMKILNNEDIFIDIGGNIGYYSLLCSNICKKVHSFEPLSKNFDILEENIKINNIKNIIPSKLAISDLKTCKMEFAYGCSSVTTKETGISVDCIGLDDYVKKNEISNIKLIKIDVEGHELNVLKTMKNTLKSKSIKYILCEVTGWTYMGVINYLKSYGYNKIYDLNTGFNFNKYYLNATTFLDLSNILKNYELKETNPGNLNLLFTFN